MVNATKLVNATKPRKTRIRQIEIPKIRTVMGVDFSGAAKSGQTAWCAQLGIRSPSGNPSGRSSQRNPSFELVSLQRLGKLAGDDERDTVNRYLVDRISRERETFWGCDFPFGLPIELPLGGWREQLSHVQQFDGQAKQFGHSLVALTEKHVGKKHVRRDTDRETQTPFDCYHYRIIYQTFHGMRDVLAPIAGSDDVAVLPFDYSKLARANSAAKVTSIVVEACPSSTLKRWGLPHQKYKQSGGKPPEEVHRETRRVILKELCRHVEISSHRRKVIMNDPGGDALDAVLAGVGSWIGLVSTDHQQVASHERYPREGKVFC